MFSTLPSHSTHFSNAKTPGRTLKGRAALQENAAHPASATVNGRGKRAVLHTPYRPESLQPDRLLKDTGGPALKPSASTFSRPLADKTPFPNRNNAAPFVTPLPRSAKISKLSLLPLTIEPAQTTPILPPSSTRKKLRIPRSASKSFETPVTKGDHWNVSDISIDIAGSSLEEVNEEDAAEPDYSDPEYMPPTAIDPPYELSFELPNYKHVGEMLLSLAHCYPLDDTVPNYENDIDPDEILRAGGWVPPLMAEKLVLPELEDDDPFISVQRPNVAAVQRSKPIPAAPKAGPRLAAGRPAPRTEAATQAAKTSRAPSAGTVRRAAPSRPISVQQSRPATSASTIPARRPVASRPGAVAAATAPVRRPISALPVPRPQSKTSLPAAQSRGGSRAAISRIRPAPKRVDDDILLHFDGIGGALGEAVDFRFAV